MAQKTAIKKIVLLCGCGFFLLFARSASAASLYLSPASGNYSVGRTFTVGVDVSSADQAMNAAQGALTFPPDKLQVISLSKAVSVMNLWVQDPSFSNQDGTVNFGGVVVNPGFKGGAGNLLTVTFQVRAAGTASVGFSSGSVLANDGIGTNILSGMHGANFTLVAATPSLPGNVNTTPSTAGNLDISSDPTINSDQWYNFNSLTFNWTLPPNAQGVDYAISNDPAYALPEVSQGIATNVTYDTTQLADGTWYFYLSYENAGVWMPATVRTFQLDRTPPRPFVIVEDSQTTASADATPSFQWAATDKTSGVDFYRIKIGDGDWFDPATIRQGSVYVLPVQSPTDARTLTVRAYDYAGNFTDASINFSVAKVCAEKDVWCALSPFVNQWMWLFVLALIFIMIFAYWLLYRVFAWKRVLSHELNDFRKELQRDLKRIEERVDVNVGKGSEVDLRPSHLAEKKASLTRAVEHIEGDVKDELKRIDKMTDKKEKG